MNDPNKAISVNLSSLLSLKAELLRKQREVKVAKTTKVSANEYKPKKSEKPSGTQKGNNYTEIGSTKDAKVYETEDHAQLEKSRRVLEAKSKYYERMSRNGGSLNSDENCLVMFNRKRQEQNLTKEEKWSGATHERLSSSESDSNHSTHVDNDEDDEVEYTDCLGRTRKCLRKDLTEAKRLDKQLADSMPERLDQTKANWMIDTKGTHANAADQNSDFGDDNEEPCYGPAATQSVFSEALSTMTKHDEQRINWERKEQENFDKPDVHYQDVFFDEARTHGVGYYAFSTDETERKQQQCELAAARKATHAEQKRRDDLRAQRDRIVADRVLAAKNRIRARNGLPPISKEEYEREEQNKKQAIDAEAAARERENCELEQKKQRKKELEDAERSEVRKDHVRDWDKDKPGVPQKSKKEDAEPDEWHYKPERLPMSQEQWNEQQRTVRTAEFAPMSETDLKRTSFSSVPVPPTLWTKANQEFSTFHSTKREKQFQRRSYMPDNKESDDTNATSSYNYGAAIPPPACLDAGNDGPPLSKRPKNQADLERSIEAGLKFLRDKCDKGVHANKSSWTAKADY